VNVQSDGGEDLRRDLLAAGREQVEKHLQVVHVRVPDPTGDEHRLHPLLRRLVGVVAEVVEVDAVRARPGSVELAAGAVDPLPGIVGREPLEAFHEGKLAAGPRRSMSERVRDAAGPGPRNVRRHPTYYKTAGLFPLRGGR
jgi:hypothetical protein